MKRRRRGLIVVMVIAGLVVAAYLYHSQCTITGDRVHMGCGPGRYHSGHYARGSLTDCVDVPPLGCPFLSQEQAWAGALILTTGVLLSALAWLGWRAWSTVRLDAEGDG